MRIACSMARSLNESPIAPFTSVRRSDDDCAHATRGSSVHAHTKHARRTTTPGGAGPRARAERRLSGSLPTRLGTTARSPPATTTSATMGFLRPRLVDFHRAAAERLLVKFLDGRLRFRVSAHLDERKPP